MKENKTSNIIIATIFVIYITLTMLFTFKNNYKEIRTIGREFIKNTEKVNMTQRIDNLKSEAEAVYSNDIALKYDYIDTYGLVQRVLNKKVVSDAGDGSNVVKLKDGNLSFIYPELDESFWVNRVTDVNEYAKEKGIYMVFAMAPWKIENKDNLPFYLEDYTEETKERFLSEISANGVNIIDYSEVLETSPDTWFYKTDHHWNTQTAFEAYKILSKNLEENLDVEVPESHYTDFSSKTKKKIFLGSYGKRTGKFYSTIDNYTYIYPNFKTSFDVLNSDWSGEISHLLGDFRHTITYEEYLDTDVDKDRESSVYYTYTNGGKSLVKIKNLDATNKKKILILKDSFAEPVFAFLALNYGEIRAIDVRCWANINLKKYIDEYKPDAIIFFHTPSSLYDSKLINFKWE